MSATAVRVEQLAAGYGSEPVLEHVTLEAREGQSVCVLGPNGGGKTTLFRALLGDIERIAGEARLHARAAYVPQTDRTSLDFPVSALDVALMGALANGRWWLQMQDDGNFVIDGVPGRTRTFVAGGGSGHGFKLGPAVGRLAADLVEQGVPPVTAFRFDVVRDGRVA